MKNLVFDFANLAQITKFGAVAKNSNSILMENDEWRNYFLDTLLITIANYVNVLKPDRVIVALENKSWRKTYYPLYKANRNYENDPQAEIFFDACNLTVDFLKKYTNTKVIRAAESEGDDVIAVLSQKLSLDGEQVVIVSTDGDFKQLLKHKGVRIFNPIKKTYVTTYSHLDYITKLVKGDSGDNVPSSYPRIKSDLLESFAKDFSNIELEFKNITNMRDRQIFFISEILKAVADETIPNLEYDEMLEFLDVASSAYEAVKSDKVHPIKNIVKMAKKEGFTESKLFSEIKDFKEEFNRNKKLICLSVDNLPEHIFQNVMDVYNESHKATEQAKYLEFVRKYKLKEFAFGTEWNILKSIKDI